MTVHCSALANEITEKLRDTVRAAEVKIFINFA
jgi:hypothetical protein